VWRAAHAGELGSVGRLMRSEENMSPRRWATTLFVAIVVLVIAVDIAYLEWRNHKVETVPMGATESEVIAIMGKPAEIGPGIFTPACATPARRCYEWSVHNNFQYVCFGTDGRVACRGSYTVWT
jgi:hypothetical protein